MTYQRLSWDDLTTVMIRTGDQAELDAVEAEMMRRPECDRGEYAGWKTRMASRIAGHAA